MASVIPTRFDGSAFYAMRVDLSAVEFLFSFRWNAREGAWFFDLATSAGDALISGVKVVVGWPLLNTLADERRPFGELIAIDTEDTDADPGIDELGDRVLLVYDDGTDA